MPSADHDTDANVEHATRLAEQATARAPGSFSFRSSCQPDRICRPIRGTSPRHSTANRRA